MCDTWLKSPSSQDSITILIFILSVSSFLPSYEHKRYSKNAKNPPKSPFSNLKSAQFNYFIKIGISHSSYQLVDAYNLQK